MDSSSEIHHISVPQSGESVEEFPMVCETCLGSNPYVRMIKLPIGQKVCKITNVPFQAYRWKAGTHGRYKETIISLMVAKERNICQGCLKDFQFDLPAGVRDTMLRNKSDTTNPIGIPISNVGIAHYYQSKEATGNTNDIQNQPFSIQMQQLPATRQLERFSQTINHSNPHDTTQRTAWRNLPKLCSFWLNGTCNRVLKKSCPFRPCCGVFVFPEIAGSDKDLHQRLQQQLNDKGPAHVMKNMDKDIREALRKALKGNREEAIKKRVSGDDDLTEKYLSKLHSQNKAIEPPEDQTITTLWIGGVEDDVTQEELISATYAYGHVVSIHIARGSKCAFIEYATRAMAEYACQHLHNTLMIRGRNLQVRWMKPKTVSLSSSSSSASSVIPPPPGLENAPLEAYDINAVNENTDSLPTGKKRSSEDVQMDSNKRRVLNSLPSMDPHRLGAAPS